MVNDENLSITELQRHASQGDSEAQYYLGLHFEDKKNIFEACKWFEKSAEQDYTDSQFKLGFYYRWGDATFPANTEKGEYWLKKAANKRHARAQFHLGNFYRSNRDFESAAYWFGEAAEQGEKRAMFRFALLNETKAFSDAKIATAVEYYTKLANALPEEIDENNVDAMINLGLLYCVRDGTQRSVVNGKPLLEKALRLWNHGHSKIEIQPYDCYRMGLLFCNGEINPNDEPSVDDLITGIELLDIGIKDGLDEFNPENIVFAKSLRGTAKNRLKAKIHSQRAAEGFSLVVNEMGINELDDMANELNSISRNKGFDETLILKKLYEHGLEDIAGQLKQKWAQLSSEKAENIEKLNTRIPTIIGRMFQACVLAAFLYILIGTDMIHGAFIDSALNIDIIYNLIVLSSPLFFFSLSMGTINSFITGKNKPFNISMYVIAIIIQMCHLI